MTSKPFNALGILNFKQACSTVFGSRSKIVNAVCLPTIAVFVLVFCPQLEAQQSNKNKAKNKQGTLKKDAKQESPYADLITGTFSHAKEPVAANGLPLWIYGNPKMMKGEKRYPLIVVLHGRRNKAKASDEFKPQGIATPWAKRKNQLKNPCFVVQPYYPPKGGWEKIPGQLDATVDHLIQSLPIDPNRVYLMGFSNGAQGTLQALARNPGRYAAAITVSGRVGIKSVVGKIKTPIRAWVGENDNDSKKKARCIALSKALKDSGVDIELVVVKGAGHACHHVPTRDLKVHKWLFAQSLKKNKDAKKK